MAQVASEPEIIIDADRAREAASGYVWLNRWLLSTFVFYFIVAALLVWRGVPAPLAVLLFAAASAWSVGLRRYFRRQRSIRLRNFIDPMTGELMLRDSAGLGAATDARRLD
jgi:hypothetical protein